MALNIFIHIILYFIKNHKIYFLLLFPLLLIPAFFDFGHIFLYQGRITESIFFIIFDTNPTESFEYILSNISWQLVVSTILYVALMIFYWMKIIKMPKVEIQTKWWKYLIIWVLLPFVAKLGSEKGDIDKTLEAYRRANHMYSMVYNFMGYREQMDRFKNFDTSVKKDFQITRTLETPKKELHVLILGESTTSTKMGVYGYHRENTPNLSKLRNEILLFEDVVSSNPPGTMANLKKILTLANTENEDPELLSINLINIVKAAGFKTYWVSNQLILGYHDTITTVFAKQADRVNFTNTTNSVSYDEKVLPILDSYLAEKDDKKFIVVHLLGTHMKYRQRFPSEFEKFTKTDDIPKKAFHNKKKLHYINDYDNSILYHDHIINEVLKRIKEQNIYSTVTFLSDHGEEVYDLKDLHGHPSTAKTINMYKIPFFIWTSEMRGYRDYINRKYVSDDTTHTILDLLGISFDKFDPTRSIINPLFIEKTRFMGKERI